MVLRALASPSALLLALLAATAAPARAQVVQGRLLESGTEEPVMLGRVMLLDTAYVVVEETYSDHDGRFTLRAPRAGDYFLAAERLGYHAAIDGILELGEEAFLPIAFYIRPRPIELEGVTARVRRRRVHDRLTGAGFYERARMGFGTFITPEEIEERPPIDHRDLFREVLAVQFESQGANGDVVYLRARGRGDRDSTVPSGYCRPRVYVDGMRMDMEPLHVDAENQGAAEIPLHQVVNVDDVIAVEVYRGAATIPLQWGGSQGNCGVIVFWTRSGP